MAIEQNFSDSRTAKFAEQYTDGMLDIWAQLPSEIKSEGSAAWVARNTRELCEIFPDAHPDDVESTLFGVVQAFADAGLSV